MFRRARFSVKPNVRPSAAARGNSGSGNSSEAPAAAPEAQHAPETTTCSAEASSDSQLGPAEDLRQGCSGGGDSSRYEKNGNPSGDGDSGKRADTPLQRRKRISTMPNLAKPRVAPPSARCAIISVSKCSQKQVPCSPPPGNSALQKESPSCEKINIENSPILPEKKTPLPQVPQFSPFKKSVNKEASLSVTAHKSDEAQQNNMSSPLKERPTQESLIQEEIQQAKPAAAKEKNICSDHEKIIKAKKLRQLLKEELKKEKQQRKSKCPIIEKNIPEDRSKMIMRDFIYYLPENNPMKCSLVEEKKSERTSAQAKEPEEKTVADHEDENEEAEEEEEEEDDGPLLVPRVKVAEDGSIILDEESLTVEVLRTKGQCVVEENDPIFERGSTTTYSSFRRSYYTKPWSEKETEMFFLAISMVGTDFSMISQLFPHRARTEIKNKFKREEKANGWRIDKAFKEKRPFDFDSFAKLLEKVLENERRRKTNDAKCQHQKEKAANETKVPKSQKKRKAKVTNGQPSLEQDDQNANISDAEMEVDCGTAEKENEESLSILEQTEGQAVTDSVVMKKKRKKKKKDSEQDTENLSEGKTIPSESVEGERLRKERNSVSSSPKNHSVDETGEELEVPDGQTLEDTLFPAEDDPQCCIQLNEGPEEEDNLISSSIQDGAFVEDESELQVLEASSEHLAGQFSKSQISSSGNKEGFEETHAETNEVTELDKLDERSCVLPSHNDKTERIETETAASEKLTIKEQLQRLEPNLVRTSEKYALPVDNALENQLSPSEPVGGVGKTIVEDQAAKITGSTRDELTERSNSDLDRVSQDTQKAPEEKIETRGRRQRPKPNIVKASGRKEAPLQGKSEYRMLCPEPDGSVRKNSDQDDAVDATPRETTEKNYQVSDAKSLICEKSTLQVDSKQTVLRPALLARGRMKKPKPNLGAVAKRQAEPPRNSEAGEEKATEATVETKETLTQHECSRSDLLTKQATEATKYEIDAPHSEALENKAVATPDKVGSIHSIQPSVKKPLCADFELKKTSLSDSVEDVSELVNRSLGPTPSVKKPLCADFELKKTSLSDSVEDVSELVNRDSSLCEIQKETAAEIQHCLENFTPNLKENLGEAAEKKEDLGPEKEMLEDNHLTGRAEKKTVHHSSEYGKLSDLDEGTKCGAVPSSHLSEGHSTDAQEAVAMQATLPSCPNISTLDSGDPREVSVYSDSQENSSLRKQSSQEDKQSAIRPTPLLRGRLQKPKPNIGRAVGRKEIQSAEKNEATAMILGTEKSKLQKSEPTRTSSKALQLMPDNKVLPAEASEDSLLDCEKMAQEDSQVPKDKLCTIKPAQLMRGRFQRARPNLGRLNGKKKDPVSENVSPPVEEEKEKSETETLMKGAHHPLSKGEADVGISLSGLEEKVQSESSEAILPERCIDQKKVSSPEKSQSCEFLKDQVETSVSKDVGEKQLDTVASAASTPQELSPSKSIKPTFLMRGHLQRPKPNLSRAAKKKDVSSEGERSTEDKAGKGTEDKSGKISSLMHDSGKQVETASSSESWRQENCADDIKMEDSKRSKHSEICDSSEQSLGGESEIRKKISNSISVQKRASETLNRKLPERTLKPRKPICDMRPTYCASECETDHSEKGRRLQKVKPNVSRGRRLKPALGKKPRKEYGSSKVNLVTLRASSQEEEEDDDDDVDDFEPYYEAECFLPEEVNKAPVFVPKGLRSPNPVSVQIEETMEELEIYENITGEGCVAIAECLSHEKNIGAKSVIQRDTELHSSQLVIIQERSEEKKGVNDGSTEAAMTLLAMRDPAFQLNISTQENLQKFPNQDEQTVADSFLNEHNEEQSILDNNMLLSAPSKHEWISFNNASRTSPEDHIHNTGQSGLEGYLTAATHVIVSSPSDEETVSSHNVNKAALVDHNAFGLEEHSQEASRVCSDGSSLQGNKICKPVRCRFPKPKPNLGRGRGVNRSASSKSLGVGVERSNQTQNEENMPQSTAENHEVELDQNLGIDAFGKRSSADKHDFQLGRSSSATQKNSTERENLAIEASQVTSVFSDQPPSPRTEIWPSELPNDSNTKINVELPEQSSDPVEHHLSTEVAQNEESQYSGSSGITEMTTDVKECPAVEEEQTVILTLVEIAADSQDCSGASASLQQASEEPLPAPVFFTSDSMELVELTREDSSGSIKASTEENTVSVANITEIGELQTTSAEKPADGGSTLKERKRHALDLEGSGGPPKKKKNSSGESLKRSNKAVSLKSISIANKTAGKSSEKLNILKKKQNSTTSRSVPEPTESHMMEEKEKPQSSLLLGVPHDTDEQVPRTLYSGKAEISEGQRSFTDNYKPVRSGQTGSTAVFPKIPSSRPYQRSLGFLPLICKTNTEEVTTKGNKQSLKKSCTDVSKSTLERPTSSSRNKKEDIQGDSSFPSTVSASSKCENVSSSTIQVCSELCENESSSKEQGKDEEPTMISEYFFRDIFMEVDDSE
ncbi:PREDICTED: transcription factor TFIIIB component B'' homolog [Gekko japonicus]|uniref:Transcription factor TFIIIB component B'' homolog n=1 Tax=Gekko japonicus TaxID=146911 RepID=A0ABM1K6W3_GEKJA|nr:PREDICTED: transcription factor TFIIIB component B'' homolog [Gekko japonicus]